MLSRSCFSETMAPHFEIVDKDIEEVKEKREIENKAEKVRVLEDRFKKWVNERFRRVQERFSRPNTVAVLYIKKLSSFSLYVIKKLN